MKILFFFLFIISQNVFACADHYGFSHYYGRSGMHNSDPIQSYLSKSSETFKGSSSEQNKQCDFRNGNDCKTSQP